MIRVAFHNLLALLRIRSQRPDGKPSVHAPASDTDMHPTTPLSIFVA